MARRHSTWSASAAERNLHCAGALALGQHVDRAPESQAAAWGTAYHSVVEWALHNGGGPVERIGAVIKTDEHAIVVDEEMVEAAEVSVNYCRSLLGPGTWFWIEDQVDLAPIGPALESGGIVDFAVWNPADAVLEIVDHKGGSGYLVEVRGHPQPRSYALGWLCKHYDLHVEWVRLTIVQPGIPQHPDGIIRSELLHVTELVEWGRELKEGIARAHAAMLAWDQIAIGDEAALDTWVTTWLRTGHCVFCPAAGQCPALRREAQAVVNKYFEAAVDTRLDQNMPAAVEHDLDRMDLVEQWIRERRAYAHRLAEGGTQFRNYMLVDRPGHRRWNESDDRAAAEIARVAGIAADTLFNRKLKSPNQVEKLLGGKRKRLIADLWTRPISGHDLVRRTALGAREPATPLVELFFEKE